MARPEPSGLSIAAVSRQTGIPVTTLRFYEKELPGLFEIRKTRGGHRRYAPEDVARFETIRNLSRKEGVKLSDVRRVLRSPAESDPIREDLERLRRSRREQEQELTDLVRRVERLESRIEEVAQSREKRRWFGKVGRRPAGRE